MKFIVCVKQVPDTSGKVAVKADGTMDRASMATITNPDDLNAVEAALALKDANPEAKVVLVSMGPAPAAGMLRRAGLRPTVRIVDRGAPFVRPSDIAAMELFATPVVGADPFEVIAGLRVALEDAPPPV